MSNPQLITDVVFDERGMTCTYKIKRTWTIAEGSGSAPAWPPANPCCEQCYDMPPPGFACTECGAKAPMPELPSAAQLLASRTP